MNIFTIDSEVVFSPERKELSAVKHNKTVIIFGTGSRCLEYLIENKGVIVSQKELISVCWGDDSSKTVSQAAYYQCLADLRRNLKEVGYRKTLIRTVRGKGVSIDANVSIEQKVHNIEYPIPQEKSILITSSQFSTKKRSMRTNLIISIMILLICFLLLFFIIKDEQPKNSMQEDYLTIDSYPECYFFNKDNVNNKLITGFLQKKHFNCNEDKNYYISHFSVAPRLTVFSCSRATPLRCESFTFVDELL